MTTTPAQLRASDNLTRYVLGTIHLPVIDLSHGNTAESLAGLLRDLSALQEFMDWRFTGIAPYEERDEKGIMHTNPIGLVVQQIASWAQEQTVATIKAIETMKPDTWIDGSERYVALLHEEVRTAGLFPSTRLAQLVSEYQAHLEARPR
jgi:hypothetical protein